MQIPGPLFKLKLQKKKKEKSSQKNSSSFGKWKILALTIKKFWYILIFPETKTTKNCFYSTKQEPYKVSCILENGTFKLKLEKMKRSAPKKNSYISGNGTFLSQFN